jgi:predicted RNase H-like nuclease
MNGTVAGVDGCKGGWIVAICDLASGALELRRIGHITDLFAHHPDLVSVAIDMPIGLPERTGPRGRTPEREVRPLLGQRQSSVFSIPARSAVYTSMDKSVPEAERFQHCCTAARATSAEGRAVAKQSFAIFPKIIQLDIWLRENTDRAARVHECHPEASFWAMNDETPVPLPKKVKGSPWPQGLAYRRDLLARHGFDPLLVTGETARLHRVGPDDLLDACAACWTAARIAQGRARSFPSPPERDAHGLPIAIWV